MKGNGFEKASRAHDKLIRNIDNDLERKREEPIEGVNGDGVRAIRRDAEPRGTGKRVYRPEVG